jgi:hypothetical protein
MLVNGLEILPLARQQMNHAWQGTGIIKFHTEWDLASTTTGTSLMLRVFAEWEPTQTVGGAEILEILG